MLLVLLLEPVAWKHREVFSSKMYSACCQRSRISTVTETLFGKPCVQWGQPPLLHPAGIPCVCGHLLLWCD